MNKFDKLINAASSHYKEKILINLSPNEGYRSRCEFGYKNNFYVMHDKSKKVYLSSFLKATKYISNLMPVLLDEINSNEIIKQKLFQINFRSNNIGNVMVSLIYHQQITDKLIQQINLLSNELSIQIILRAKNELYKTSGKKFYDRIEEHKITLTQTDYSFYQPNSYLLKRMISKVNSMIEDQNDLMELYCGVGTFTLPLSKKFNKIFATENNRSSLRCLQESISFNKINNISFSRLSDIEVSELLNGRKFNRMNDIDINSFNFSHVLVDPPRSGMNSSLIEVIKQFTYIIYVSCNPNSFFRDIEQLKGFKIIDLEAYDQFPSTQHLEIISLLKKTP